MDVPDLTSDSVSSEQLQAAIDNILYDHSKEETLTSIPNGVNSTTNLLLHSLTEYQEFATLHRLFEKPASIDDLVNGHIDENDLASLQSLIHEEYQHTKVKQKASDARVHDLNIKSITHDSSKKTKHKENKSRLDAKHNVSPPTNLCRLIDFDPSDTSSVITTFSSINFLQPVRLPSLTKEFLCEVSYIISPICFYIFPLLPEFCSAFKDLRKAIDFEVQQRDADPLCHFEVGTFCLACYSKDKQWYRAYIQSMNPRAKTYEVLYLDYLNTESLTVDNLKPIPQYLIDSWPARVMKVHFPDVKLNPRRNKKDIKHFFKRMLLKNFRAYVRIKQPKHKSTSHLQTRGSMLSQNHSDPKELRGYYAPSVAVDLFADKLCTNSILDAMLRMSYVLPK